MCLAKASLAAAIGCIITCNLTCVSYYMFIVHYVLHSKEM